MAFLASMARPATVELSTGRGTAPSYVLAAALVKPAAAQTTDHKDTTVAPGVVNRVYGEGPSIIPSFKTVTLRDIIIQPGSKTPENQVMMNAMICHITEGELRVVQDGKTFTAKRDFVWTCNKDTKEHSANDGGVVAIMRVTDLKA